MIVRPNNAENAGRIVTVIARSDWVGYEGTVADWLVKGDRPLMGANLFGERRENTHLHLKDDQLRPIRPDEGQDETLDWKALPSPLDIIKELT